MIELGAAEPPAPLLTWRQTLAELATLWYANEVHPSSALNPLHVSRFWPVSPLTNHQQYRGDTQRPNDKVTYETYSTARMAIELGPSDPAYDELELLTLGSQRWLFGIHFGVRGRYVFPPSDREWECGAFLPNVGSVCVVQNTIAPHFWEKPSVLAGCGGRLYAEGDPSKGPDLPPWSYLPQQFGNTETFLRRDGSMLMACESAARLLHPFRVYEAEAATPTSRPFTVEDNNDPPPPDTTRFNGGQSIVGLTTGDWFEFFLDPQNGTGAPDPRANERDYWILLRVGNASFSQKRLDLDVFNAGAGSPFFTTSVDVPTTEHRHEYVVVTAPEAVTLNKNNQYRLRVTEPFGDVSVDCIELKSRGK
jgi:hypothetical protein